MELIRHSWFHSVHKKRFIQSLICFIFICTWPDSVFSLWFFRLQPKLMMRRALGPLTLRRELIFKRPDKEKRFLLDHSTKASQHQIKPVEKKSNIIQWCECWIQYRGAKIELLNKCGWKHISACMTELMLVNASSGSIKSIFIYINIHGEDYSFLKILWNSTPAYTVKHTVTF